MDPESELLGDEPVRLPRSVREVEPERPGTGEPWRPPRWLLLTAALAVLTGLLAAPLWYADQRARAHEAAALDSCRRALRSASVASDLEMTAVAGNLRPTLATTTGSRHGAVLGLMSNPAREVLPAVLRADRRCHAVHVRPWHRGLTSQQAAAAAYSAALVARLRAVAADGRAYFRDDAPLRRLRRAADLGVLGGRW